MYLPPYAVPHHLPCPFRYAMLSISKGLPVNFMFPAHRLSRVRAKDRGKILLQILPVEKTVEKVVLISWKELGSIRKDTKGP